MWKKIDETFHNMLQVNSFPGHQVPNLFQGKLLTPQPKCKGEGLITFVFNLTSSPKICFVLKIFTIQWVVISNYSTRSRCAYASYLCHFHIGWKGVKWIGNMFRYIHMVPIYMLFFFAPIRVRELYVILLFCPEK